MFNIFKKDTKNNKQTKDLPKDLTKAERKALKKKEKEESKTKGVEFREIDNKGLFVDETPYSFSTSYMGHNGKYVAVVNLHIQEGSNRNNTFLDYLDFIPNTTIENVELYLKVTDKMINHDVKRKIIRDNSGINKSVIINREQEDRKKSIKKQDDSSKKRQQEMALEDYISYEEIIDSTIPLALYDVHMIVIGESIESVEEQISQMNSLFDQFHSGAKWVSEPGKQKEYMENLFSPIKEDKTILTARGDEYAGFNLSVNAGLHDPKGVAIGIDKLGHTHPQAYLDFDKSLISQAIISTPRDSYNPHFYGKNSAHTLSSTLAQAAANDSVMKGKRVHHIVLNSFDYFDEDKGYILNGSRLDKTIANEVFKVYDMSNETLNPLQAYGEYQDENPDAESIESIYSRLLDKIINIFDVLQGFDLDKDDRIFLNEQLDEFYKSQRKWSVRASENPRADSHIIQIQEPEVYPKLDTFISFLRTQASAAAGKNQEQKEFIYETLAKTLRNALTQNSKIIGRASSIQPSHALQTYYDYSKITSDTFKHVQLLNTIDYILYTADKGDVVVIHGFDNIYTDLMNMLVGAIESAKSRGVRFIFSFDSIIGANRDERFKYNDMFNLQHKLYKDLSSEVDYFVLGTMLENEVYDFEHKYLNRNLGTVVRNELVARDRQRFLIHRGHDSVNNFISSQFII